jgi:peptidoglycan/xylan/chitin deacetylase (PgdA/CDA1 family)
MRGVTVSHALDRIDPGQVAITFDDGCETDLLIAAPLLKERGWNATFFVTVGFLNQPGYMTPAQVRELSDLGFEVGSHSMTHPYLDELQEADLQREIGESKSRLEDMTGRAVQHFSNPGGRSNKRSREIARAAGYESVSGSRLGTNGSKADRFDLTRIAILKTTTDNRFDLTVQGRGFEMDMMKQRARDFIRKCLGNTAYDALRGRILGDSDG